MPCIMMRVAEPIINLTRLHLEPSMLARFIKDESGATAIEYGLIAALVAVAIIAALTLLGDSLSDMFDSVAVTVQNASS